MGSIKSKKNDHAKKLLCIEDEYFIGALYTRTLERAGYDVTLVQDGQKGLKEAQTDKYDIILLDLMLASLSGMEILQILRDPSQIPHLRAKIIITTNLEQQGKVRANIESQADAYLIKAAITPRQLVEFLSQISTTAQT